MPDYVASSFGKFIVSRYQAYSVGDKRGVELTLAFRPTVLARNAMVGLIQIARAVQRAHPNDWARYYTGDDAAVRTDFYAHWFVDNGGGDTPVFKLVQDDASIQIGACRSIGPSNQTGCYRAADNITNAALMDEPKRTWTAPNEIQHRFETVAMALTAGSNAQVAPKGKVLGSITWGYTVSAAGVVAIDNVQAREGASYTWTETKAKWNAVHRVKIPAQL